MEMSFFPVYRTAIPADNCLHCGHDIPLFRILEAPLCVLYCAMNALTCTFYKELLDLCTRSLCIHSHGCHLNLCHKRPPLPHPSLTYCVDHYFSGQNTFHLHFVDIMTIHKFSIITTVDMIVALSLLHTVRALLSGS